MSLKISVFVATSLDGFIARKDGSLDWLDKANESVPQGEDGGFHAFMKSVDAIVMGRNTYEQVQSFGKWPYGDKRVIVLSSKKIILKATLCRTVTVTAESPKNLYDRLAHEGAHHIYVDGGLTIQSFMKENLVDELTLTLIPIILGEGKPLFENSGKDVVLKHMATKTFDCGFVQLTYKVEK